MKIIYKEYVPTLSDNYSFDFPANAKIVHFAYKDGGFFFWYEHDPSAFATKTMLFKIVGTGHEFEDDYNHVQTVIVGSYVWHLLVKEVK